MLKTIQGCFAIFFLFFQAWFVGLAAAQPALTPCVSSTASTNPYATTKLIHTRYIPTNMTTMVVDTDGKFVHFDSLGNPVYSETIPLPNMTMFARKAKIVCAMFGTAEIYIILSDGRGFTYSGGSLINPVNIHPGEYNRGEGFLMTPKDDVCIRYVGNVMRLYQFNPATQTVVYNTPYSDTILDSKLSTRANWNKEYSKFSFVINTKSIFTATIVGTAPNYQIQSDSAPGTYVLTMNTAQMITSNVGVSDTRFVFNTIEQNTVDQTRSTSLMWYFDYADMGNPVFMDSVEKMVYSYMISSVFNGFLATTNEGQTILIDTSTFTFYRLRNSAGKHVWVHPRLAEPNVLAAGMVAYTSQETLQLHEVSSTFILTTLISRPTYAVDFNNGPNTLLVYQNLNAHLFNRDTQVESPAVFGDSTRTLRKLVYGSTSNKIYCLYTDSIVVLDTACTVLYEKDVLTVSNDAFANSDVDSFKDFDLIDTQGRIFVFFKTRDESWTYNEIG